MGFLSKILRPEEPSQPWYPPLPAEIDAFEPAGQPATFRGYATVSGEQGRRTIFRSGSATSLVSQSEADRQARESAERNLALVLAGSETAHDSYAYGVERQLEPVIDSLVVPGHAVVAQVTVNGYGALVVNANSVLFVDVDTRADQGAEDSEANDRVALKLRSVLDRHNDLSFRVYRTRNGWRYLCTSRSFDPTADETRGLLEELGADKKYVLLCRVQKCFRARLTPKPWRIGESAHRPDPVRGVSRKQLEYYLRKAAPFATAAFTAEVGTKNLPRPPEVDVVVTHHDAWCAVNSGRPLA